MTTIISNNTLQVHTAVAVSNNTKQCTYHTCAGHSLKGCERKVELPKGLGFHADVVLHQQKLLELLLLYYCCFSLFSQLCLTSKFTVVTSYLDLVH